MTVPEMNEKERGEKLVRLEELKCMGEKAYDEMYEVSSQSAAGGPYANAKDAFIDAIQLARELGLGEECARLEERLEHIKSVFRGQFG
jgi:hypothetical protein